MMKLDNLAKKLKSLSKYRYVLLVLAIGLVFVAFPSGIGDAPSEPAAVPETAPEDAEQRLALALSAVEGAGEVKVLLGSRQSSAATAYSSAAQTDYPGYTGAVIICAGADDAKVRLELTRAVAAYTGLGSDKITVLKLGNDQ